MNYLRFPCDREVLLGKSRHNLINTRFCVVESYGNFVSEWIRIVLKNTRDFLQGITYPARSVLSLASEDYHSDYFFGGKKGLRSNEQEDQTQNAAGSETFTMLHKRAPQVLLFQVVQCLGNDFRKRWKDMHIIRY